MSNLSPTVLDLFNQVLETSPLGSGQDASVYDLPNISRFVLRIYDSGDNYALDLDPKDTLTAYDYGFGIHSERLGAGVLMGGGISIHFKQPGTSLTKLWRDVTRNHQADGAPLEQAQILAKGDVLKAILSLPDAEVGRFFEDIAFLHSRGRSLDLQGDNIMFDPTSLRVVDTGRSPEKNNIPEILQALWSFDLGAIKTPSDDIQKFQKSIEERFSAIASSKKIPQDSETAKSTAGRFADKERIPSIRPPSLSDPAADLQDRLDRIQSIVIRKTQTEIHP